MRHIEASAELLEGTLTLVEFCNFAQLTRHDVADMVDMGVLEPVEVAGLFDEYRFLSNSLRRARMAKRLMRDMGINPDGIAMIVDLIEEREILLNRILLLERMMEG